MISNGLRMISFEFGVLVVVIVPIYSLSLG